MNVQSLLSLLTGLLAVLGLLGVGVWLLRRGIQGSGSSPRPELHVSARAGLTRGQGVAIVETEGRRILVSYGEGGVRTLTHLETGTASGDEDPLPGEERPPIRSFERDRVARVLGILGVVVGALLVAPSYNAAWTPMGLRAQEPSVEAPVPPREPRIPEVNEPERPEAQGAAHRLLQEGLPSLEITVGEGEEELRLTGPVGAVLFIGFLTLIPTLLLLMTSFTRILVVLHLLKQALGTQTAPPAHLLGALALLLTSFVMAPTLREAGQTGVEPWLEGEYDEVEMLREASIPFRAFMLEGADERDLVTFLDLTDTRPPESAEELPLLVVTTAFVTSELRRAFQMGFVLFLPFVVIDLVVASVLMSMGMFMLPPVMISLPFKLLLFVLVDGWSLVLGGLVRSFN